MKILLSLFLLSLLTSPCSSQDFELKTAEMSAFIDSMFNRAVNENYIPGGIIGVVHKNEPIHAKGYGLADIDLKESVDFSTTKFQLGSVGKVLTAIAVLQEVEKGNLDLDADVNDYLTEFQISTPTERSMTLRDLLTHTAGLNERYIGYAAHQKSAVEPLGMHLKRRLPSVYIEPGKEASYSNYGFGLAGYIVELSSNKSFREYIQIEIFDVLNMNSATYQVPDESNHVFASGYESMDSSSQTKPLFRHVIPAGSIAATGNDLMKLVSALTTEDNALLSAKSYDLLKTQQFTMNPLLTGYGLGTEIQNFNGHVGAGKAGGIPGFYSYIVYFPQYGFGMFLSINISIDDFLESFTLQFKNKFFPPQEPQSKNYLDNAPLSRFTGEFRSNRYNRNTIEDIFTSFSKTKIYETQAKDSALLFYHNGKLQYYKPIDELVFQNTKLPNYYLIFNENASGKITHMNRNEIIAGVNSPATYEKLPWHKTDNFINETSAYFLIAIVSFLILPIVWLIILLIRKKNKDFMAGKTLSNTTKLAGILFSLVTVFHIFQSFMKIFRMRGDIIYGIPESIMIAQSFSLLLPILLLIIVYRLIKVWMTGEGMLISRIYYSLFAMACTVHVIYLHEWHFIGLNY